MAYVEPAGKDLWRVRYQRDDGALASLSGFTSKDAAQDKADSINKAQRGAGHPDPAAGRMPMAQWAELWFDSIDVARTTRAQYLSLTRNHLLPRWGTNPVEAIGNLAVHTWANQLRARGLAVSTVKTIVKLLTMMLADAADEGLIPTNPVRPRRRGRRNRTRTPERLWATPEQVLHIALQAARLVGNWAGVLDITAAWTGARWGELAGLQRINTHLDDGCLVVDPDIGSLHEVDGRLELGPPKTPESARTITLPPFLIDLLRHHLDTHDHPHVFVTADHQLLRRSNHSRRAMRPAADGNRHRHNPAIRLDPVKPGLTFHGFRHSHKTWLIADGLPEVAQARRLGHKLPDKIQEIYSHVAPEVETRLLNCLQKRWTDALAGFHLTTSPVNTPWSPPGLPEA
ncbi:site-specific integrase [Saccharothrix xinjiangensis]|uniref:tyrosine-type recombinase/integrase n=1 Tax=Saccharothrix xinjiangensis TaxID=204798 RepID=UPI0031CF19CA